MNSSYRGRHFDLSMLWLSALIPVSGLGLFYFYDATTIIPEWVIWSIAGILLTELTLLDMLRNQRIQKKVVFAFVLQFIPIPAMVAYWWWKIRWQTKGNAVSK